MQQKQANFLRKFSRITSGHTYLPEVDGLRCLALFSVVAIIHISHYLDDTFFGAQFPAGTFWGNLIMNGGSGMTLFFMTSGFILSLPFARWQMLGGKKVQLKNYYLRRLTRLEPPYLIALLLFFAAHVWVTKTYTAGFLFPHLLASAVYLHNFIYHSFSLVLPVAWSLEVEVQFYVMAPLLFLLFRIRSGALRRGIFVLVILANAAHRYNDWGLPHVLKFMHCFFMGLLLCDLYCHRISLFRNESWGALVGMASALAYLLVPSFLNPVCYAVNLLAQFFLFHAVLTNSFTRRFFSIPILTVIGGMCYSIYLLHYAVISFIGQAIQKWGLPVNTLGAALLVAGVMLLSILLVSAVYFRLVERPFMGLGVKGGEKRSKEGAIKDQSRLSDS